MSRVFNMVQMRRILLLVLKRDLLDPLIRCRIMEKRRYEGINNIDPILFTLELFKNP